MPKSFPLNAALPFVCSSWIKNDYCSQKSATYSPMASQGSRRKTLLAFMLSIFAMLCNNVSLAWIHERVPIDADPLPDIWFTFFPEYTPAIKVVGLGIAIFFLQNFTESQYILLFAVTFQFFFKIRLHRITESSCIFR